MARKRSNASKKARQAKRNQKRSAKKGGGVVHMPAKLRKGDSIVISGLGKYGAKTATVPKKNSDYGSRLGSVVGEGLQSLFSYMTGLGAYKMPIRNSLMMSSMCGGDPPRIMNTKNTEAFPFAHREFIGNLYTGTPSGGVTPFTVQTFPIQIGNSGLFPWGASIARNFQHWVPKGIVIELKTISSNYAANISLGEMAAGVDYNALDPPPTNMMQLLNMEYSHSSKPSQTLMTPIECAPKNNVLTHLFIAKDGNYENGDRLFFDVGNLFIATEGIPVTGSNPVPIAEIWVTYEVNFFKPILPPVISPSFRASVNPQAGGGNFCGNLPTGIIRVANPSDLIDIAQTQELGVISFNAIAAGRTYLVAIHRSKGVGHDIIETDPTISISGSSGFESFPDWYSFMGIPESTGQFNPYYTASGVGAVLKYTEKMVVFVITLPAVFDPAIQFLTGYGFNVLADNDNAFGLVDITITEVTGVGNDAMAPLTMSLLPPTRLSQLEINRKHLIEHRASTMNSDRLAPPSVLKVKRTLNTTSPSTCGPSLISMRQRRLSTLPAPDVVEVPDVSSTSSSDEEADSRVLDLSALVKQIHSLATVVATTQAQVLSLLEGKITPCA